MAQQSKQDIEEWYKKEDPWGYEDNGDDRDRKQYILDALSPYAPFKRALDIGAGEGFITKDLPANKIEAIELSETAAKRIPSSVKVVKEPSGKYDLIVLTGVLYDHYDREKMLEWAKDHCNGIILTCNIEDWEINPLPNDKLVHHYTFPYRTYTQSLKVYKWEQ